MTALFLNIEITALG